MDRISKEDFFSAILSSDILVPYIQQDSGLAEMIKFPNHPDIHYFETPASAKKLAPTLRHRLNVMAAKNISHNLDAMKKLVAFMEEHPDSEIYNVTFNCQTKHYGVRCGRINNQLHVICVMTGGRIPNELLGESVQ